MRRRLLTYFVFFSFIISTLNLTLFNYRKKTVVVSLWNDLATSVGQQLLDMADKSPVVAIKSLKVGDFQGTNKNILLITNCKKRKCIEQWI